jgi:hypothetical protein
LYFQLRKIGAARQSMLRQPKTESSKTFVVFWLNGYEFARASELTEAVLYIPFFARNCFPVAESGRMGW